MYTYKDIFKSFNKALFKNNLKIIYKIITIIKKPLFTF